MTDIDNNVAAYIRFTQLERPYKTKKKKFLFWMSYRITFEGSPVLPMMYDYETASRIAAALNAAYFEGWLRKTREVEYAI